MQNRSTQPKKFEVSLSLFFKKDHSIHFAWFPSNQRSKSNLIVSNHPENNSEILFGSIHTKWIFHFPHNNNNRYTIGVSQSIRYNHHRDGVETSYENVILFIIFLIISILFPVFLIKKTKKDEKIQFPYEGGIQTEPVQKPFSFFDHRTFLMVAMSMIVNSSTFIFVLLGSGNTRSIAWLTSMLLVMGTVALLTRSYIKG